MFNGKIMAAVFGLLSFTQSAMAQDFHFDEVTYSSEQTVFKLFAPKDAKRVEVLVTDIDKGNPLNAHKIHPYQKTKRLKYKEGIWTVVINGDLQGKYYSFKVQSAVKRKVKGHHLSVPLPASYGETPGVFAKAVGVNGKMGAIIDLKKTNPEGWAEDKRPALKSPSDLVIYELHYQDFTADAASGIEHKGKFLALTEPKAIQHLKALGINAIHILPSFDYASVDETRPDSAQYNWGYDPQNYNVPEGSYSTNPYDPQCRIREFKQMVQALHQAGIRVILDVVYNHTFNIDGSGFQRTYPDYYYRKTASGKYSNGSGCGNETASEQPMMRRFMLESVKYWINEYHIDGFRFDLMGVHDLETMNSIRAEVNKIDPSIFIYGEGWSAGSCAYPSDKLATKANVKKLDGIAAFSDDLRDALRGPFSDDTKGAFLAGIPGAEESLKFGIVGAISHPQVDMTKVNYSKEAWANEPTQQISYVSCHDDMCLVDRLKAELPGIKDEELIRLDELAQTAVFTSQGVPFMLCGEEMLRSKQGVHNSFNSPIAINKVDWSNLKKYPQVFAYYQSLIQLRKNHAAFRLGTAEAVRQHLEFLPADACVVAYHLKNLKGIDTWQDIVVVLNANKEEKAVEVPEGTWKVACCDGVINETGIDEMAGGKVIVDAQSALILYK
ncbi:MAG: type I pullulanase [Prevotella sp.]|jgi:pullulanase|nr:type I pullulanase [Prevotella sp.]MCI1282802.1 type I pullulanase [Prevotella sp.]